MPSKSTPTPIVGRDGINGRRNTGSRREQNLVSVEVDATFARTMGLSEGHKVYHTYHTVTSPDGNHILILFLR